MTEAYSASQPGEISPKLWLYTNYDCNLSCKYCVAESHPRAPQRALGAEAIRQVVEQAAPLGFQEIFLTGGEPFLLADIFDTIEFCARRMPTTVLTNAVLLRGSRLDRLERIGHDADCGPNLTIQVSLDGGRPEHHDPQRGAGTWAKTVEGIRGLQERGLRVHLSTTETDSNCDGLVELHALRDALGIAETAHFVRPLAKRGFAQTGEEVSTLTLVPELTITQEGAFWHPLAPPEATDMLVSREFLPLAKAVNCLKAQLAAQEKNGRRTFT